MRTMKQMQAAAVWDTGMAKAESEPPVRVQPVVRRHTQPFGKRYKSRLEIKPGKCWMLGCDAPATHMTPLENNVCEKHAATVNHLYRNAGAQCTPLPPNDPDQRPGANTKD